jgi:adenylate cyclase
MDYELGPFRLDVLNAVLLHGSEPVALGRRAVALLQALIEKPGALVSKDVLIEAAWPGQAIEDSNLAVQIAALRRALAKAPGGDRWIVTMPRRGYRFVGPVVAREANFVPGAPLQVAAAPEAEPIGHDDAECHQITALSGDLVAAGTSDEGLRDLAQSVGAFQPSASEIAGRRSRRGRVIVGMTTAVALVFVCLAWWLWPAWNYFSRAGKPAEQATGSIMPAITTPTAAAISPPLVAPRLSIVVLPFINLSSDPDQQYFADGITENLTTDLSRIPDMFVISSNSAFTYRGKRAETRQIGQELGVRYVLEGSVERLGTGVRLNAQLIDSETHAHLWAERFDGDTSNLFALQDEVTRRIAISLKLELIEAEATRPTRNPDALDLILRGLSIYLKPVSHHRDDEAIGLLRRAVELDPSSVEAQIYLAAALASRQLDGYDSPVADIKQAEALSLRALAAAPRDPVAHFARAQVLRSQGRLDEAIFEYQIALASDRNYVNALANMGRCMMYIGPIEDGISAQLQAIRLSPRDPNIGLWYFRIGQGRLIQSRFEDAIRWLEKARNALPELPIHHSYLAAAYALHGDAEQAAAELTEAQRRSANYSSIARLKPTLSRDAQFQGARPEIRAMFEATYFAGLRKAGMPEE